MVVMIVFFVMSKLGPSGRFQQLKNSDVIEVVLLVFRVTPFRLKQFSNVFEKATAGVFGILAVTSE